MNKDLEALILAWDAYISARDLEAVEALRIFDQKLDAELDRHTNVSREILKAAIIKRHLQWARAQVKNPPSIPPKA